VILPAALQRDLTERLLLSALRETSAAEDAESAQHADALEHSRIYGEALLAREQAELATHNKQRFLAQISHEIRTPLNAMMGYVEVIAEGIHGPVTAAQQDDLARIRLNQNHLRDLVDDLLAFVQVGAPRINRFVSLDIDETVARAVALIENTMTQKSITYEHTNACVAAAAWGDPERVRQILVNLLANAVKFTARGGRITTACDADDTRVYIRVTDTGIGIPAKMLSDIFEPFVQVAEVKSQSVGQGVGLGLAISRDLARGMRGDISVQSTLHEGSCFTLMLPRSVPALG
jgi:signal transduction histidine kinase